MCLWPLKIFDIPKKSRQADSPYQHRNNRGDGNMSKAGKLKKDMSAIVTISLLNYDPAKQDEYSQKFMLPLIEGLLKRMQLAKAE